MNQKYPTFDYLHQGSQTFHFEIILRHMDFNEKVADLGQFLPTLVNLLHDNDY